MQPPCAAGWNNWEGFGAGRDLPEPSAPRIQAARPGIVHRARALSPPSHGKGLSRRRFEFGQGVSRSDAHGT